jgi:predicted nucleic acid-binding Zn ribbon protein
VSDDEIRQVCDDITRRQRYRRGPKSIADVLSSLIARRGYAQIQTSCGCEQAWQAAVGDKMAAHSRVGNVRRGILEVTVSSSAVMQELMFQKRRLLQELTRTIPEQKIRDFRFRVGVVG